MGQGRTRNRIVWDVHPKDAKTISEIVKRAERASDAYGWPRIRDLAMDITACHANGCPLDLERMLAADDFNFAHDITGIHANLDRSTGRLGNQFVPRYAARPTRRSGGAA
jgi:hypothetical protein